jgi:hypothetical protein
VLISNALRIVGVYKIERREVLKSVECASGEAKLSRMLMSGIMRAVDLVNLSTC